MTELRHIAYKGWDNAFQLTNGQLEIVITGDVGPRIIHCGLADGPNLFYEDAAMLGKTGGDGWINYGGHRLWHAPEHPERTYQPDNSAITVGKLGKAVRVRQPTEAGTGITKSLDLYMAEQRPHIRIVHHLKNDGLWPVSLAPWALSVMAAGGMAILPLPPRGKHPDDLLPNSSLILWPYTDLTDPRWLWGKRYIRLQQTSMGMPLKVGATVPDGWLAYWNEGYVFVKLFDPQMGATYPDQGSMAEIFTNQKMLELETLAPQRTLDPGQTAEHIEDWLVFTGIDRLDSDEAIEQHLIPLIETARKQITVNG